MSVTKTQKLRGLPVQLIELGEDCILLKRGYAEVKVSGQRAAQIVHEIFEAAINDGATCEEICGRFAKPERDKVRNLIDQFRSRRLLIPTDKSSNANIGRHCDREDEIFYWHLDKTADQVEERLSAARIAIIGVNAISRQLGLALTAAGIQNLQVVDDPLLRNLKFFTSGEELNDLHWPKTVAVTKIGSIQSPEKNLAGCVVATSDFGGRQTIARWNNFCISSNKHFMPVLLDNVIGYIGPFVVPGETACFECLRSRERSQGTVRYSDGLTEDVAFEGQRFTAFHPSMASILGDLACLELTKFYSGTARCNVGTLLEVNFLRTHLVSRKVLRIPRCIACSALNKRSSVILNRLDAFKAI